MFYYDYFRNSQESAFWSINQQFKSVHHLRPYFDLLISESRRPNNFSRILMYVQLAGEKYIKERQSGIFCLIGGRLIVNGLEETSKRVIIDNNTINRYTRDEVNILSSIYATAFLETMIEGNLKSRNMDQVFVELTNMLESFHYQNSLE
jgi:hypothetical protein